jgi:membrane-bound serine protease (ClpP class)
MVLLQATAPAPPPAAAPAPENNPGAVQPDLPGVPQAAPAAMPGQARDAFAAGQPLQAVRQKAAIIHLDAPVDDMMFKSLKRRIDIARKAGCSLIIFDLDTYGGQVTSALEISKFTKKLPAEHLATVAWVHDKAYSAGALVSVACQQIIMTSQGSLGDCAPIRIENDQLEPLPDAGRAKFSTPVTQEFDNSADTNGYDKVLLRAMVETPIQISEVHNARTGESRFVDDATKTKLLDEQADLPGGGKERPWRYVRTVDSDKQLLTVGAADALAMHLSRATINNENELKAALNIDGEPLVLEFNWAERATVFLTQTWIRFLLFVGMLVFAWVELSHPGISVAGIASVLCLVLLVGAPFLTGLAQIWEIALIVLGLAVIIGDVVAFGGLGMLAIPGFILMAIGLVASFVPAEPGGGWVPTMSTTWNAMEKGLGVFVGGSFMALASFFLLSKYLYMTPGFSRLQLAPANASKRGTTVVDVVNVRDIADRPADEAVFVGALGVADTDLRPAGRARFGDHLVNVLSDGSFIPIGAAILVIEIAGTRIVVKALPAAAGAKEQTPPAEPGEGGMFP